MHFSIVILTAHWGPEYENLPKIDRALRRPELPLKFRLPRGRVVTRRKGRKSGMFKVPKQVYTAEFKLAGAQRDRYGRTWA